MEALKAQDDPARHRPHRQARRSTFTARGFLGVLAVVAVASLHHVAAGAAAGVVPVLGRLAIREADIGSYEMETLTLAQARSPLHGDALRAQYRAPGEHITIRSKAGAPFSCRIPTLPEVEAEDDAPLAPLNLTTRVHRAVTDRCVNFTQGWWTYGICFGANITQFHLPDGRKEDPALPPVIVIGRFVTPPLQAAPAAGSSAPVAGQAKRPPPPPPPVYEESFDDGALCDITGRPRKAVITFHCRENSPITISNVVETSTCSYKIIVSLDEMCNFRRRRTTPRITCVPQEAVPELTAAAAVAATAATATASTPVAVQRSTPPVDPPVAAALVAGSASNAAPDSTTQPHAQTRGGQANFVADEESAPKQAASEIDEIPPPIFAHGDTFVGNYTCQGDHGAELVIVRSDVFMQEKFVEYHSVYGFFSFHHPNANGTYELVGVYRNDTRRLAFMPGRWVVQPSRFVALGIDGVLSTDGISLHGIVPQCFASPFHLRRGPPRAEIPSQPSPQTTTCFGNICTKHCVKETGPHTIPCLGELWDLAGCAPKALRHPLRAPADQIAYWSRSSLKDILRDMSTYYQFAHSGRWPYPAYCLVPNYHFQSLRPQKQTVEQVAVQSPDLSRPLQDQAQPATGASPASSSQARNLPAPVGTSNDVPPPGPLTSPNPQLATVAGDKPALPLSSRPSEKLNAEWIKDLKDLNQLLRNIVSKAFTKGFKTVSNSDLKKVTFVFEKLNADTRGSYIMRANGLENEDIDLELLATYWVKELEIIDYLYDHIDAATMSWEELQKPSADSEEIVKRVLSFLVADPRSDVELYLRDARHAQDRLRRIEHGYKEQRP